MTVQYEILGKNLAQDEWDGKPVTLKNYDGVTMPQTPNGSAVFGYKNMDKMNSEGALMLTSGGMQPQPLDVPALANAPSILVGNWQANNLNVTNVSASDATPILVELYGPGIPGVKPGALTIGEPTALQPGDVLQGRASPNYMQFKMTSKSGNLGVIALIGGPVDSTGNNAYVFALNFSGTVLPPGYTKVTGGNTLTFPFNWGSSTLFLANMSPETAADVTITLISL